ncbi:MAG: DivIVA domain-containing protein [Oscillospiraceae bacterium]|nr:DivIVA domain-containing protein [Oscillospiraceae bacterium]
MNTKHFSKSAFGYKPEEVESFIREIVSRAESIERENEDLKSKVEVLARSVQQYRDDETSMKNAILSAQKLSETLIGAAKKECDELMSQMKEHTDKLMAEAVESRDAIIGEANNSAGEIMKEAEKKIIKLKDDYKKEKQHYAKLQKEIADFKAELLQMYKGHLDVISGMPDYDIPAENTAEPEQQQSSTPDVTDTVAAETASDSAADTPPEEIIAEPIDNNQDSADDTDNIEETPTLTEDEFIKDYAKKKEKETNSKFEISFRENNNTIEEEDIEFESKAYELQFGKNNSMK